MNYKKALKLMENGKSPGENNINSEYGPEEFTLRLLQFLNSIYIKFAFQMNGEMPL